MSLGWGWGLSMGKEIRFGLGFGYGFRSGAVIECGSKAGSEYILSRNLKMYWFAGCWFVLFFGLIRFGWSGRKSVE